MRWQQQTWLMVIGFRDVLRAQVYKCLSILHTIRVENQIRMHINVTVYIAIKYR